MRRNISEAEKNGKKIILCFAKSTCLCFVKSNGFGIRECLFGTRDRKIFVNAYMIVYVVSFIFLCTSTYIFMSKLKTNKKHDKGKK